MSNNATKEKILKSANDLFADKGYSGTSVREIAQSAGVNLAAINYHFTNKENLYREVFKRNYVWMQESIKDIASKADLDMKEFTWQVFNFFLDNGRPLMNTFKIFLNANLEADDEFFDREGAFGPPGQEHFIDKIKKELGDDTPYEGITWAVKMIFSCIVHFGISMNSPLIKKQLCDQAQFQPEEKKRSIYNLVDAILAHLKLHKSNWPPKL